MDSNKSQIIYRAYVTISVCIILGLYIGFIPVDLGNDLLGIREGVLFPFNPQFLKTMADLSAAYVLFATVISALGALVSIGTRNIFEVLALFWLGMLPKEHKHWGVIFDQQTNQTISFVPVRLFKEGDGSKQLLSQTVTDTDGRYRLNASADLSGSRYILEVYYPGYKPVTQNVDQFLIIGNYDLITDIPLAKAEAKGWNIKHLFYYYRPKLFQMLFYMIYILYLILFIVNLILLINSPIFINVFSFILIGITGIWNTKIVIEKLQPVAGQILDEEGKSPIAKALVKVYGNDTSISAVADDKGIVRLNLPAGIYKMLASATGYLMLSPDSDGLKVVKVSKDGYIAENVLLKKDISHPSTGTQKLINPFK